ncbi:MAG: BlaI/MecI/CopY family transcriptional regulator [Acidobacteriota bacterium]|nr:BlaI/MecI/CopY family transcriptional regulator [Acidobacteriota bacterium]MDH3785378.1 BlaI/MecI/CopY family transcriptional regulator [Acidobacteriota bacterium]
MTRKLPDLSRFELQCLRMLWSHGEASVRDIHDQMDAPPSYSTIRKIFERLEDKGAVRRVRKDGKAWIYASGVKPTAMIRKEIQRFLDSMFDGAAGSLVSHLADMDALSVDDLKEIEQQLVPSKRGRRS